VLEGAEVGQRLAHGGAGMTASTNGHTGIAACCNVAISLAGAPTRRNIVPTRSSRSVGSA
jgi:hypothetical protein